MATNNSKVDSKEISVEEKLRALYDLQMVASEIDKIKILRGELPLEVQDLEDEIAGLQTRIENFQNDIKAAQDQQRDCKATMEKAATLIEKYKADQDNVRNNREYESLNKEIEFQKLEIQLCERKTKEQKASIKEKNQHIDIAKKLVEARKADLVVKKQELEEITKEADEEEKQLRKKSAEQEKFIEERYLSAYKRIRGAARNGLAVVPVEREACGGCFSKIPFQRQMEIKMHRKIIVCEHCGRILVDKDIVETATEQLNKK